MTWSISQSGTTKCERQTKRNLCQAESLHGLQSQSIAKCLDGAKEEPGVCSCGPIRLQHAFSSQMSSIKSDVPNRPDRTAESRKDMVDSAKNSSGSEHVGTFENTNLCENQRSLPGKCNSTEDLSLLPSGHLAEKPENGITSSPFPEGKIPLRHGCYANGYRIPQASVRQQPQVSKKQRVSSTTSVCSHSSKNSCRSTASQIQEVAGDDRCAHCALACLFCEFMSLCSLALDCMGCGGCLEACCSTEGGETLAKNCCGDADGSSCPCGFGCGMLQDCCSSSDCLEICLDCCSICFPA
uniref:MyoD family inhibitor domain-containing protein n=1 Tax=Salvator merianae TaxID=96440 RepID=A0A8D0E1G9_SALMN